MLRNKAPVALTLLLSATAAHADMRCGTELISEGESVLKLLSACGEPAIGDPDLYLGATEWTYNFGPDEFMMKVIIQDGRVERFEQLDWGVDEPERDFDVENELELEVDEVDLDVD